MSDSKKSIRLPDEILSHIFTYLPIKSIIICTSLSKTWKSLIQNPTFISTHLHHSHNNNKNNLLLLKLSRNDKQVYALHKEDDLDFTEYTSFDSPFHGPHLRHPHNHVIGTCNGLLCLSDGLLYFANELFLWNPCVRKLLQFPIPRATFDSRDLSFASFGFGFGFDPKSNDYKVVRILSLLRCPSELGKFRPAVDVYSLSTGEWRTLSASASLPPTCGICQHEPPAFANGALHWIAFRKDYNEFVLVFDLGDEVFRQILLPELPGKMMWTRVSVYGNSIAGFERGSWSGPINIWVMKEYGVASSWTKFSYQCPSLGLLRPHPVGFRRNGEVVLEDVSEYNIIGGVVVLRDTDRRGLISWNPDSLNVKNLEIDGSHKTFLGSYVESLALLDKATKGPHAIMVGDEL